MDNSNLVRAKEFVILSCVLKMLGYKVAVVTGQPHTGTEPEEHYVDLLNELHDAAVDIRNEIIPKDKEIK